MSIAAIGDRFYDWQVGAKVMVINSRPIYPVCTVEATGASYVARNDALQPITVDGDAVDLIEETLNQTIAQFKGCIPSLLVAFKIYSDTPLDLEAMATADIPFSKHPFHGMDISCFENTSTTTILKSLLIHGIDPQAIHLENGAVVLSDHKQQH